MADEKNAGNPGAAASAQAAPQAPCIVKCVKFGREMPGLDRIPWKGDIGKRIYDNVSKEAWKLWVEHSKMLMNEFRLNPLGSEIATGDGRTDGDVFLWRRRETA